jgi:hypothetical protein
VGWASSFFAWFDGKVLVFILKLDLIFYKEFLQTQGNISLNPINKFSSDKYWRFPRQVCSRKGTLTVSGGAFSICPNPA